MTRQRLWWAFALGLVLAVPCLALAQTPQVIKLEVPCNNGSPAQTHLVKHNVSILFFHHVRLPRTGCCTSFFSL